MELSACSKEIGVPASTLKHSTGYLQVDPQVYLNQIQGSTLSQVTRVGTHHLTIIHLQCSNEVLQVTAVILCNTFVPKTKLISEKGIMIYVLFSLKLPCISTHQVEVINI